MRIKRIVTPYAGVWIEMEKEIVIMESDLVTPYAGVWIEIGSVVLLNRIEECHSLRGSVD